MPATGGGIAVAGRGADGGVIRVGCTIIFCPVVATGMMIRGAACGMPLASAMSDCIVLTRIVAAGALGSLGEIEGTAVPFGAEATPVACSSLRSRTNICSFTSFTSGASVSCGTPDLWSDAANSAGVSIPRSMNIRSRSRTAPWSTRKRCF